MFPSTVSGDGGDTRRQAITRGELDRAVEGGMRRNRTSTGRALLMTKLSESVITRIGRCTIGALFSSQVRAGSRLARDRRERVWRRRGEHYAACNIIQHDRFGCGSVMVWGGRSLEGRTNLQGTRMKLTHCQTLCWCSGLWALPGAG